MVDVGFGSGLLRPLPLRPDVPVEQGLWTYRLTRPTADVWQVQEHSAGQWVVQYTLTEEPQHLSDVVMANHFTSTSPDSPFVAQPVVVRKDEHHRGRTEPGRGTRVWTPRGCGPNR